MAKVTVYTTPTCPWCSKLKISLDKEGISYNEVNVAEGSSAAQEMIAKTGQRAVPVTTVGDQVVIGYDPEGIKRLL